MDSHLTSPISLGSTELVTIDQLVDIVEDVAGITVKRNYDLTAPKGVRGRNSDNTTIRHELGWEPTISLREGLESTFSWIYDQLCALSRGAATSGRRVAERRRDQITHQ
jgi:nucleoside-diphosphate-sugar epimerase